MRTQQIMEVSGILFVMIPALKDYIFEHLTTNFLSRNSVIFTEDDPETVKKQFLWTTCL